jgi:hypothetical protein
MFTRSARQPPTQLPTAVRKAGTNTCRLLAVVAAVTSGLVAGTIPAQAQAASPGAYGATITALSPHFPGAVHGIVDGYALVIYKVTYKKYNTATISGEVTGAANGDVVTLLAEPFGAKAFAPTGTPITLSSPAATTPYSFAVQPSAATSYEIQVTTAGHADVTSSAATVYVTFSVYYGKTHTKCTRTTCTFWYPIFSVVPAAAYKTEAPKHLYLYLSVGYPRQAKYYSLSTSATATKAVRINSGEYKQRVTFYIRLRRGYAYWSTFYCSRDTESRDGLGLPGHHGCGDKRISDKLIHVYVG